MAYGGWRLKGVAEQLSEGCAGRIEEITERLIMEPGGKGLELDEVWRAARTPGKGGRYDAK